MLVRLKQSVFLCGIITSLLSCQSGNGNFRHYAVLDKESAKGNTVISYSLTKIIRITEWGAIYHYRALCIRSQAKGGHVFLSTDSATIFSPGAGIILINGHQ